MAGILEELPNGYDVTADDYNALVQVINLLARAAVTIGGTEGDYELPGTGCGGRTRVTPDSSGNANITFPVDFDDPPAVTVTGSGGVPNVLVTIATSGTPVSTTGFRVHCQDTTNATDWAGHGSILISWTAVTRNGPDDA